MPPLPILSGAECVAALRRGGFGGTRREGGRVRLERPVGRRRVAVPLRGTLGRGALSGVIGDAGLTVAEFLALLGR